MKNRGKDYIPILTIVKVFVMFAFIWVLKLNIDGLLNLLLIISAIEIVATNYRKSVIKWILMLIELYSIILYIPLKVMIQNPLSMFNGLIYMLIVIIFIIIDFSIYIEKI